MNKRKGKSGGRREGNGKQRFDERFESCCKMHLHDYYRTVEMY